jgi:hypothetical protein
MPGEEGAVPGFGAARDLLQGALPLAASDHRAPAPAGHAAADRSVAGEVVQGLTVR